MYAKFQAEWGGMLDIGSNRKWKHHVSHHSNKNVKVVTPSVQLPLKPASSFMDDCLQKQCVTGT